MSEELKIRISTGEYPSSAEVQRAIELNSTVFTPEVQTDLLFKVLSDINSAKRHVFGLSPKDLPQLRDIFHYLLWLRDARGRINVNMNTCKIYSGNLLSQAVCGDEPELVRALLDASQARGTLAVDLAIHDTDFKGGFLHPFFSAILRDRIEIAIMLSDSRSADGTLALSLESQRRALKAVRGCANNNATVLQIESMLNLYEGVGQGALTADSATMMLTATTAARMPARSATARMLTTTTTARTSAATAAAKTPAESATARTTAGSATARTTAGSATARMPATTTTVKTQAVGARARMSAGSTMAHMLIKAITGATLAESARARMPVAPTAARMPVAPTAARTPPEAGAAIGADTEFAFTPGQRAFMNNSQSTHDWSVNMTVKSSVIALKNRYQHLLTDEMQKRAFNEIESLIDHFSYEGEFTSIALATASKKQVAKEFFELIRQRKGIKHSCTDLTYSEILCLVWLGVCENDKSAWPEDLREADVQKIIALRKSALVEKFIEAGQVYRNGYSICVVGAIHKIVRTLDRAHADVTVITGKDSIPLVAANMIKTFVAQALERQSFYKQLYILKKWNQADSDSILQQFIQESVRPFIQEKIRKIFDEVVLSEPRLTSLLDTICDLPRPKTLYCKFNVLADCLENEMASKRSKDQCYQRLIAALQKLAYTLYDSTDMNDEQKLALLQPLIACIKQEHQREQPYACQTFWIFLASHVDWMSNNFTEQVAQQFTQRYLAIKALCEYEEQENIKPPVAQGQLLQLAIIDLSTAEFFGDNELIREAKERIVLSLQALRQAPHRALYKPVFANMAIALTGVGLLALAGKFAYSGKGFFATTRRAQMAESIASQLSLSPSESECVITEAAQQASVNKLSR